MKPLRLVDTSAEQPIDIQALNRADIKKRDWAACHVNGDRQPPLEFTPRKLRTWRV